MKKPTLKTVFYNALLYLFWGGLWILLTDRIVLHLVSDPRKLTLIQTFKGFAFVVVSTVFLYFVGRRDLLALKYSEESLSKERDFVGHIMETSPMGIMVVDCEGRITFANYWAEQVLGLIKDALSQTYKSECRTVDMEGHPISDEKLPFKQVISTGQPVYGFRYAIEWPDGRHVFLSMNAVPVLGKANGLECVVATADDITKSIATEEKLKKSQEKLAASENWLKTIIDTEPECIKMVGVDGAVQYMNPAGLELIDADSLDQVKGVSIYSLIDPEYHEGYKQLVKEIFEGKTGMMEFKVTTLGKAHIWLETHAAPFRDENNDIVSMLAITRDITERKKAEEELRLLQTMTKAISESEDFFSALDITLRKICKTTGWVYGETWVPSHDNSHIKLTPPWYSVIEGLEEFRKASEAFRFHKDVGIPGRVWSSKKPLWVRDVSADGNLPRSPMATKSGLRAAIGIPILAGGDVVAVLVFFVTEARNEDERFIALISAIASQLGTLFRRKMAEEALRDSERKLRLITENTSDVILAYDMNKRLIYVNPAVKQLTGYSVEEVKERDYIDWTHPDDKERVKRLWEGLFVGKGFTDEEIRIVCKEGRIKWSHSSWGAIYDYEGQQIGVQGSERDITERKRMEEELRLLQTLMQDISLAEDFRSALDAAIRRICEATGWVYGEVWVPSSDGSHLECGPGWYGSSRELDKFRKISEGFRFQPGIGLPGRVWSSKKSAWIIDVTVDANFPRAPYAKEAGLKAAMGIPILAGDEVVAVIEFFVFEQREEDGRLVTLVSTVAAYLGILFQRKQVEEKLRKFFHAVEQSPASIIIMDAMGSIEYINPKFTEVTGYPKDEVIGKNLNILSSEDMLPEGYEELWDTVTADKEWRGELHHRKKNGELFWEYSAISPVKNAEGVITNFIAITEDVTERKKLEDQLRHAQKLEAIGQLVGGIAHDFNNMLAAVIGFAGILQMKMDKDDPLMVNVEQILESAERGASLTQSLLVFGRKQIIHPMPVNLNEIVEKVGRLLLRLIGESIKLKTEIADEKLTIMADSLQIEQVLINLATNARDAMPDGGTLIIEISRVKLDREFVKAHGYGGPGAYALISVSDTGVGMDEKTKERIFEPFFTTKEVGKGTGLGLSIVYGIVKQHNGFINVYSEVGKGTTFRIYLPLVKRKAEEIKLAESVVPIVGTETVLVAEDDASVRSLSKKLLETFGYKVIEAVDGEEAAQKYMANKDKIQLLVMDVMMPGKNGKEAYEEILKVSPGIKVLFMSGYTADVIQTKWIVEKGLDFISKPVSPTEFLRKVREVLDR